MCDCRLVSVRISPLWGAGAAAHGRVMRSAAMEVGEGYTGKAGDSQDRMVAVDRPREATATCRRSDTADAKAASNSRRSLNGCISDMPITAITIDKQLRLARPPTARLISVHFEIALFKSRDQLIAPAPAFLNFFAPHE